MAPTEVANRPAIPKMKMTTPIPPSITTPDSVDTRIGTLKFFDGFPDDATVQKVMDNLDFMRVACRRFSAACLVHRWSVCAQVSKSWALSMAAF